VPEVLIRRRRLPKIAAGSTVTARRLLLLRKDVGRASTFRVTLRGGMIRFRFVAVAVAVAGCGSDHITLNCANVLIPAFEVTALDSVTSQLLSGTVTVIATRHGNAPDTTRGFNPVFVDGDPGKYDLVVRSVGYADWSRQNVNVEWDSGNCHPVMVRLAAKLQQSP